MSTGFTLIALLIVAGALVSLVFAAGIAAKAFYKVPEADEALVRTGGKQPMVTTAGGQWVIPLFHKITRVSLQAIRIPIDRRGGEALPTSDKLMAEIVGELFVQVNPQNEADIIQAVQSIGTSNPTDMAERVREKIDSLVTDALRTAAFKKTYVELNSQKKEFADEVIDLLQEDLAKLGLTLTAVSIPHIYQGQFTSDAGDVFAAEGRRNVAATVEANREQTNRITREAQIKVMEQDVDAREKALALDLHKKQKEADQNRAVLEYQAQQESETKLAVLQHEKATAQAEATQAREVETARIEEARRTEEARIDKEKTVQSAEIARAEAVKLADERRLQAVAEAEIAKQIAIVVRREEEALARAKRAAAEAESRRAEEQIITVEATALAAREREVSVISAQEEAQKQQIAADRDAYVLTREAQAGRDATQKRAEGYANDIRIRAEADFEAADKQASARRKLAEALLEEGRAQAEARRLMVEAENAIAKELLVRDVLAQAVAVAPDVMRELMAPVANVAHDVKILQVSGLGADGGAEGLPATILNTGLAAAGGAPFLKEAVKAISGNDDVKQLAGTVGNVAAQAVKEAVNALAEEQDAHEAAEAMEVAAK